MRAKLIKRFFALALLTFTAAPVWAGNATNGSWTDPAATGYADTDLAITDAGTGAALGPGIKFKDLKFSTGVYYVYKASTSKEYFTIGTWNSKGTKMMGTGSASSKLYTRVTEVTPGTAVGSVPDSIPAASSTTAWATATWSEIGK